MDDTAIIASAVDAANDAYAAKISHETKHYQKQARQQLKMQCLDMASRKADGFTAADIVANAKTFYAFARS